MPVGRKLIGLDESLVIEALLIKLLTFSAWPEH